MGFDHVAGDVQVFPSVGLRHSTESVRVNFGHTPFKYDIDDHVQQRRDTVWANIQCKSLNWRLLDLGRDITGAHASREGAEGASPTSTEDEGRDDARLVHIEGKASIARVHDLWQRLRRCTRLGGKIGAWSASVTLLYTSRLGGV
ncbi:hypothetical protein EDB84DRAFT_1273027 [Lactarius hengduanensis]|nr:hypothetical protein EDB84DRAFT_1273027 [Lactarius hengduanensis]